MNRSFRAKESLLLDSSTERQQRQQLRASLMAEKDEELSLFLEMRRREKNQDNLLVNNPDEFVTPLGSKSGTLPVFNLSSGAQAARKGPVSDDFLNSEGDKNDYEWLLTPPGTPLFPSLEMESQRTMMMMNQSSNDSKNRSATLTSRLANSSTTSRQQSTSSSLGLSSSNGANRRPSSSGGPGSRPATPTGRSTNSKPSRPSTPTSRATVSSTTRPSLTSSRSTVSATTKPNPMSRSMSSSRLTPTASKPTTSTARSAGSLTRSTTTTSSTVTKSAGPSRSTTPLSRTTARSSTPTSRPTLPPPKTISRSATPTRRPTTSASPATTSQIKSSSPAPTKSISTPSKNPALSRGASPTTRSRPWKPSDMPGFSLETPPNLRTTLPERPLSATRGRPGGPGATAPGPGPRSGSVEPSGGRLRRQSCSPSRGRAPMYTSGSSVPAINRNYSKANDNVSPVVMGTKMVERVINMRKLAPPRSDEKSSSSPHGNLSAKSSSPDSGGFGRTLSKKSLDMAIRHMDIRRTIPGNLRPLMTNVPASSMYSVRSGHTRGRPMNNVSDSPLATSSNASSEISVCNNNNNGICLEASEKEDDAGSERGCCRSPASLHGR